MPVSMLMSWEVVDCEAWCLGVLIGSPLVVSSVDDGRGPPSILRLIWMEVSLVERLREAVRVEKEEDEEDEDDDGVSLVGLLAALSSPSTMAAMGLVAGKSGEDC